MDNPRLIFKKSWSHRSHYIKENREFMVKIHSFLKVKKKLEVGNSKRILSAVKRHLNLVSSMMSSTGVGIEMEITLQKFGCVS